MSAEVYPSMAEVVRVGAVCMGPEKEEMKLIWLVVE
jgi:hypothetical protein